MKWMARIGALLALLGFAGLAAAQFPGKAGRVGPDGARGEQPQRNGNAQATPPVSINAGAQVAEQLDQLEDALQLAPAQRDAWTRYANHVQRLGDEAVRNRFQARSAREGTTTGPEQVVRLVDAERRQVAILADIVESGRTFYASLTPEQKALADRRMALPIQLLLTGIAGDEPAAGAPRDGPRDGPPRRP